MAALSQLRRGLSMKTLRRIWRGMLLALPDDRDGDGLPSVTGFFAWLVYLPYWA